MAFHEDSDIKIFNSSKADETESEVLNLVESMDNDRKNGNFTKANKLGTTLARLAVDEETKKELGAFLFEDPDLYCQVGVLLLFSTEAALNYFLPSTQLSTIAIMALHNALCDVEDVWYKDVLESPAYSFYYLSIRKGTDNVPLAIGESFAMLCKHEGDEQFITAGTNLYLSVLKEVEKDVLAADFQ